MFTPEQETYLATLADAGLAEQKETADRNVQVLLDAEILAARADKLAALQVQAQAVIDDGLAEFDTKVAPTITIQSDLASN